MNAELDPLLNAYLDGELNAHGRRRVERASRSDPAISDRLQALSRTRDLVATLSSPGVVDDVSGGVLTTLADRAIARRRFRRRVTIAASVLVPAMAAALMLMVLRAPTVPAIGRSTRPTVIAMGNRPLPPMPRAPRMRPSTKPAALILDPDRAINPAILAKETRAMKDRDDYYALVRSGELRRIDVTVDRFGPTTETSLEEAIRKTNFREPKHARFRLVQDVSVPPGSTKPSCALVLVMDQYEHEHFRRNLDESFPDSVAEAADPPTSDVLRSIAGVGHLEIVLNTPRGTLMPPPADAPGEAAIRLPKRAESREEIVDRRSGEVVAASKKPARTPRPSAVRGPSGEPRLAVYVVLVMDRRSSRN